MILLRPIFRFFESLAEESSAGQLAAGITLGMFLGFTPPFTLHWFFGWLLLVCLRLNVGTAFLSFLFFSTLSPVLDPWFHLIGRGVLTEISWLTKFWARVTELPVIPYTGFYNTVVMGSFVICLILAPLIFLISFRSFRHWGPRFSERFRFSGFWRSWTSTRVYQWYLSEKRPH
jgi:uncharacterized protein (TIGR03546 family)